MDRDKIGLPVISPIKSLFKVNNKSLMNSYLYFNTANIIIYYPIKLEEKVT